MTIIRFFDADGAHLGDVRIDGETLDPDPAVADIVRSHQNRRQTAAQFEARYRDWSNGYIRSSIED